MYKVLRIVPPLHPKLDYAITLFYCQQNINSYFSVPLN